MARSSGKVSCVVATVPMAVVITVLCLFLANEVTHARRPTTYYVGGEYGWNVIADMDTWARSKTFYAGDILVFKYDDQLQDLWVVNRTGYEMCKPNDGAIEYGSGDDRIRLPYGYSYYIGIAYPDHCSLGLKLAIKALAPK